MPIYDYTCARCGHLTEVIHGIHEGGPHFCPNCGAEGTMRKGFAAPAVHFKGSGWAKKDRSATSSPGRSKTSKSGDEAGAGSGAGSSGREGSSGGEGSASTKGDEAAAATATTSTADRGD
ncbi:MAG: zinc ribbon domain-containing protein [Chloroflexota bacterium]